MIAVGADNQLRSEFVKQASAIPIVETIPSVAAGFMRNIAHPGLSGLATVIQYKLRKPLMPSDETGWLK